jgi:hypothetical protein
MGAGREALLRALTEQEGSLRGFIEEVRRLDPPVFRAPATAVFHDDEGTAPPARLPDERTAGRAHGDHGLTRRRLSRPAAA